MRHTSAAICILVAIVLTAWNAIEHRPSLIAERQLLLMSTLTVGDLVPVHRLLDHCVEVVAFLPSCEYCRRAALAEAADPGNTRQLWVTRADSGIGKYHQLLAGRASVVVDTTLYRALQVRRVPVGFRIASGRVQAVWYFNDDNRRVPTNAESCGP
jgi:hypothetical protein